MILQKQVKRKREGGRGREGEREVRVGGSSPDAATTIQLECYAGDEEEEEEEERHGSQGSSRRGEAEEGNDRERITYMC